MKLTSTIILLVALVAIASAGYKSKYEDNVYYGHDDKGEYGYDNEYGNENDDEYGYESKHGKGKHGHVGKYDNDDKYDYKYSNDDDKNEYDDKYDHNDKYGYGNQYENEYGPDNEYEQDNEYGYDDEDGQDNEYGQDKEYGYDDEDGQDNEYGYDDDEYGYEHKHGHKNNYDDNKYHSKKHHSRKHHNNKHDSNKYDDNAVQKHADQDYDHVFKNIQVTGQDSNGRTVKGILNILKIRYFLNRLEILGKLKVGSHEYDFGWTNVTLTSLPSAKRQVAAPLCPILSLVLGPLFLNILGLVVNIPNPIILNIVAVSGQGNLLGNLLCVIANLLNGPNIALVPALADVANAII